MRKSPPAWSSQGLRPAGHGRMRLTHVAAEGGAMTCLADAGHPSSQERGFGVWLRAARGRGLPLPRAPDRSAPPPLSPFQPVPQPVVCEQRRRVARRAGSRRVRRAGRPVLPGLLRAPRTARPLGLGRLVFGIAAVRRGHHGHRHSRRPVRCRGPGPPPRLLDARVASVPVTHSAS